jgi:hypothetical protein
MHLSTPHPYLYPVRTEAQSPPKDLRHPPRILLIHLRIILQAILHHLLVPVGILDLEEMFGEREELRLGRTSSTNNSALP